MHASKITYNHMRFARYVALVTHEEQSEGERRTGRHMKIYSSSQQMVKLVQHQAYICNILLIECTCTI